MLLVVDPGIPNPMSSLRKLLPSCHGTASHQTWYTRTSTLSVILSAVGSAALASQSSVVMSTIQTPNPCSTRATPVRRSPFFPHSLFIWHVPHALPAVFALARISPLSRATMIYPATHSVSFHLALLAVLQVISPLSTRGFHYSIVRAHAPHAACPRARARYFRFL
jgi:hypothetical protein